MRILHLVFVLLLLALFAAAAPAQISMGNGDTGSVGTLANPSQLRLANGSSAAPSLGFSANGFDGFYWLSTGNVVFSSNGNPAVRLGNNLGITLGNTGQIGWANTSNPASGTFNNFISTGTGTPEGAVTAPAGSLYLNVSGGASTTLYIKESGSGNTGWIAK